MRYECCEHKAFLLENYLGKEVYAQKHVCDFSLMLNTFGVTYTY